LSRRARLLASLLAFVLPLAASSGWGLVRGAPPRPEGLAAFPRTLGPWTLAEEAALSAEEREMLAPDAYVSWHYTAPGRSPVSLYVALYDGPSADGRGAHDPALCYPASGWEVTATSAARLELAGGGSLRATRLRAHQGNLERETLYWFQPAGRWPAAPGVEQLVRIADAVAGRRAFAFVRISVPVSPEHDAARDLLEFAAEAGWPVRHALAPRAASGSDRPSPASRAR
jgi:EpsI family protein